MTHRQLQDSIDTREFEEWKAFYRHEAREEAERLKQLTRK